MGVALAMKKYNSMEKAQNFFDKLQEGVGEMSPFKRVFTVEEVTEAMITCEAEFQQREETKKNKAAEKNKGKDNVEIIFQKVIQKFENIEGAEPYFEMLHRQVGQENKLGIMFTEEQVTEAWLRCMQFFEEA